MHIAVLKESHAGEKRVALVPGALPALAKKGFKVLLEAGAGAAAGYPDAAYEEKGATVLQSRDEILGKAEIIAAVRAAGANKGAAQPTPPLRKGQILIAQLDPLGEPAEVATLAATGVAAFSLELVPRITRAQSMDVLSSMATVAGYKAVLMGADHLPRMFPLLMTAAGTITPARVFIVGVGVAGLQAIATAKRLGAVVHAYDVRPAVKEQVESLGGRFVELPLETGDAQDKGGYAKAMDEEFLRKQRELMLKVVAEQDVVITTAAVPGKKAPILITAAMVHAMKPGSVVIDIAAERGGNCELTKAGETVDVNGVKVVGPVNLPSTVPYTASQMYAQNVANFILNLFKKQDAPMDLKDQIAAETLVCNNGEVTEARVRKLLNLPELTPAAGKEA